jgi:co-chaperonin GroES (HSP10)
MKYKPLGARLLVDPIITTVSLEKRAELAGIEIVLEQDNVPRPSQGRVIAVGSDPLLQEEVKVGNIVFFKWHDASEVWLEGVKFLQIEHQSVTGVMFEDVKTSSEPAATPTAYK